MHPILAREFSCSTIMKIFEPIISIIEQNEQPSAASALTPLHARAANSPVNPLEIN
jgi:hypothetical protein